MWNIKKLYFRDVYVFKKGVFKIYNLLFFVVKIFVLEIRKSRIEYELLGNTGFWLIICIGGGFLM